MLHAFKTNHEDDMQEKHLAVVFVNVLLMMCCGLINLVLVGVCGAPVGRRLRHGARVSALSAAVLLGKGDGLRSSSRGPRQEQALPRQR